jgi:hypothetical protein
MKREQLGDEKIGKEQSTIAVRADSLARAQLHEKCFELPRLSPAVDGVQGRQGIGIQRLTTFGGHDRE